MKKSILLLAAMACVTSAFAAFAPETSWKSNRSVALPTARLQYSPAASRASEEPSIVFGYCQGYAAGLGVGQAGVILQGAMEIPADKSKTFEGNTITKVRIGVGEWSNSSFIIFITKSLEGARTYTQRVDVSVKAGWEEFELTTPYVIDGEKFFVGFQTTQASAKDYPIGVDGVPTSKTTGDYIAINNSWQHIGSDYGNICVQAVITGNNLPEYYVAAGEIDMPEFVAFNAPFSAAVSFANNGTESVTSVEVSCTVDGKEVVPSAVSLENSPVAGGSTGYINIDGLVCEREGVNIPVKITIDKVNGHANENSVNNSAVGDVSCVETTYQRRFVVEEWTGTWCGFCPRGIVGMEYMEEKYGDEYFIGIAVHGGSASEPMLAPTYNQILNQYGGSFPGCIMNRTYTDDPNPNSLEAVYKYLTQKPSLANVSLTATAVAGSPDGILVSADAEFGVSTTNSLYTLAFVVTEDNVGPYYQQNYFAGGSYGAMGGWERKSSVVSTVFNHVARGIYDCMGIKGSLPAAMQKGTKYNYTTTLPLNKVAKIENCHVVAMIINTSTGQIENAAKVAVEIQTGDSGDDDPSGIVELDSSEQPVEYYNLQGVRVENPSNGIFIRRQGASVTKELIR